MSGRRVPYQLVHRHLWRAYVRNFSGGALWRSEGSFDMELGAGDFGSQAYLRISIDNNNIHNTKKLSSA